MPKQFHDLIGQGQSMLQTTAERFRPLIPVQNHWVVTHQDYRAMVQDQLPELPTEQILCEPAAHNTAPSIAYACYAIAQKHPAATLVITPADHVVQEVPCFLQTLQQALETTLHHESLMLLGTLATQPATGYGYIHFAASDQPVKKVLRFIEKPPLVEAQRYVQEDHYAWNTGIFVGRLATFQQLYQNYLPEVWQAFEQSSAETMEKIYASLPTISFDHGVVEKATKLGVLVQNFGWSDVGTWATLYDALPKDAHGNVTQGNHITTLDTEGCLIKSTDQTRVVTCSVKDLVIVKHDDTILVANRHEGEQLKTFVANLQDKERSGSL